MLLEDHVGHLADLNEVHLSEPIDEDRHRQPHVYTIRRSDLAGGVVDGRKFDVDFAKKRLHRAGARLLVVHRQDDQSLPFIDVAGTLNQRHLVLAGHAPGGPEVKDNRLAAVLAETNGSSIEGLGREIRGGRSDGGAAPLDRHIDRRRAAEKLSRDEHDQHAGEEQDPQNPEAQRPGKSRIRPRVDGGVQCDKMPPTAAKPKSRARYAREKWNRRDAQRSPVVDRPRNASQKNTPPSTAAPAVYTGPSQMPGTRLTASNTTTYVRINCRVSASLATAGSIGTPTSRYWRRSKRASDQKCGGVQKKMTANSATAGRLRDPVTTAQPTSGGKAPAAPPTTMFCRVERFSQTVYTNT